MEGAARQDDRAQRAVGAAVHDDVDVLGDEAAVGGGPDPVRDDRRVALRRRGNVLVAVVDHPDRLAAATGEERGMDGDDRGVLLLAPEPAAGLGLHDLRLRVAEAERPLERLVDVVRALEAAVDRDPAVLARHGDHRVVLDVQLLLVADAVRPLDDDVGFGEARLHVAGSDLVVGEDVVRDKGIEDRLERFGPRPDRRNRGTQGRSVRGGNERERLGLVADLAALGDEDRLVVA